MVVDGSGVGGSYVGKPGVGASPKGRGGAHAVDDPDTSESELTARGRAMGRPDVCCPVWRSLDGSDMYAYPVLSGE